MNIDTNVIKQVLGKVIPSDLTFDYLGLVNDESENVLSFCDDERYLEELDDNAKIKGVFILPEIRGKLKRRDLVLIESQDPRHDFYMLVNHLERTQYVKEVSTISAKAHIDPKASVAEYNVHIADDVIVGPHATVLPDVVIESGAVIEAGAVVGAEGFQYKRTLEGILSVFHGGQVRIGKKVVVGANTTIDKGFSFRSTEIGEETKIDNLVHIAHAVHIGKRGLVAAGAVIAGYVTMGDDIWIGPGALVSNSLVIGNNVHVAIGSLVVKNVKPGQMVVGGHTFPSRKIFSQLTQG